MRPVVYLLPWDIHVDEFQAFSMCNLVIGSPLGGRVMLLRRLSLFIYLILN